VRKPRSEQLRRRETERLIESIYAETDRERRKTLIASLVAQEAENPSERSSEDEFAWRRKIERLIELIYDETDPDNRRALVALLAQEEANQSDARERACRHDE
jgi:hypothetical protein